MLKIQFLLIMLIGFNRVINCFSRNKLIFDSKNTNLESLNKKEADKEDDHILRFDKNNEYSLIKSSNPLENETSKDNINIVNVDMNNQNNRKTSTSSSVKNDELLVNTGSGKVRGRAFYLDHHIHKKGKNRQNFFGRKKYRVNAWLGIPFAEKPIGDLKFRRPVPIKNWNGVINATELPNCCVQLNDTVISGHPGVEMWNANTNVSEDCLYLNIWAPHPVPKNSPVRNTIIFLCH
jgi:hypothetical protein